MDVSVILSTWNNSRQLAQTLDEMSKCTTAGLTWEIVVCDNNSTDDTAQVLGRYCDKLPLTAVFEARQGLSNGRNAAFAAAKGELVVVTDDDVFPSPMWIAAYWSAYRTHGATSFFGGPIETRFEDPAADPAVVAVGLPSVCGYSEGTSEKQIFLPSFLGPNWALPAEALRSVGGFDPERGLNPATGRFQAGEESMIQTSLLRRGFEAWYVPDASLGHFIPRRKTEFDYVFNRLEETAFDSEFHLPTDDRAGLLRLVGWTLANGALHGMSRAVSVGYWKAYRNFRTGRGRLRARAVRKLMFRGPDLYG